MLSAGRLDARAPAARGAVARLAAGAARTLAVLAAGALAASARSLRVLTAGALTSGAALTMLATLAALTVLGAALAVALRLLAATTAAVLPMRGRRRRGRLVRIGAGREGGGGKAQGSGDRGRQQCALEGHVSFSVSNARRFRRPREAVTVAGSH